MSQTFAERCAAAVAAVPHGPYCLSTELMHKDDCGGPCNCDRDARIGKGMAAMLTCDSEFCHSTEWECARGANSFNAEMFLAAFAEATK